MAVSVLMYHQIGKFSPMNNHRSTYCHVKKFTLQMWFLHFFKYKIIRLDDVIEHLKNNKAIPNRSVVLTFDDGYKNFYQFAYPVLKKYRFPSIVYILSNLIGKESIWFKKDNRDTPPLLTIEEINYLKKQGVDFGSHGRNHVKLAEVSLSLAREEIEKSKEELENIFGFKFEHFCYPYGSLNEDVKELVKNAGYKSGVSCYRGAVYPMCDLYEIPRKAISYGDNIVGFFWKLEVKNRLKK